MSNAIIIFKQLSLLLGIILLSTSVRDIDWSDTPASVYWFEYCLGALFTGLYQSIKI